MIGDHDYFVPPFHSENGQTTIQPNSTFTYDANTVPLQSGEAIQAARSGDNASGTQSHDVPRLNFHSIFLPHEGMPLPLAGSRPPTDSSPGNYNNHPPGSDWDIEGGVEQHWG